MKTPLKDIKEIKIKISNLITQFLMIEGKFNINLQDFIINVHKFSQPNRKFREHVPLLVDNKYLDEIVINSLNIKLLQEKLKADENITWIMIARARTEILMLDFYCKAFIKELEHFEYELNVEDIELYNLYVYDTKGNPYYPSMYNKWKPLYISLINELTLLHNIISGISSEFIIFNRRYVVHII